ncbi:MAG: DMT family transporter [Alphaproteobacteria bacterium]|nr:DMT family transporter [Alphaproteobacteria bacterium]MCW5744489.1 DMT family transporter [Alphaproteobacteria bacterium]
MSAIALSLLAAAIYGAGDFVGGLAARRVSALFVVGVGQVVGLLGLAAALPLFPADQVRPDDLWWGAASGLSTAIGITLLYQALATGRMSVVAPITALCALAVPVVFAFVVGLAVAPLAAAGIGVAAIAVALICREPDLAEVLRTSTSRAVALAVAAGLGIGVFYVTMGRTDPASGLWPLVAARGVSTGLFAVVALAMLPRWRQADAPAAVLWRWAALCGLFDSAANALYLMASHEGNLAVVATLTSLYPASTVFLAAVALGERLRLAQIAGLGLATLAVVMIVLGR